MQQRYFQYLYKYTLQALSIEALTLPLFALYFEACSPNHAAWTNKTSTFPAVLATCGAPEKAPGGIRFSFWSSHDQHLLSRRADGTAPR